LVVAGARFFGARSGPLSRSAPSQAQANGQTLAGIASVASFFVSRVDTEIDKRLEKIGTDEALALRGKAGIANSRLAYAAFQDVFQGKRWAALTAQGAKPQRPLWASTGVKNPDYSDTMYVTELTVADTVNTMPEKTLQAFADHGRAEARGRRRGDGGKPRAWLSPCRRRRS
jgi:transaldolase